MVEKTVESKYALAAPSYRCRGCESEVPPGEGYISAIAFAEEAFVRAEYCAPCWDGERDPGDRFYAYWRSRRPEPSSAPPRRRRFDLEIVWGFFLSLDEELRSPAAADDAADTDTVTDTDTDTVTVTVTDTDTDTDSGSGSDRDRGRDRDSDSLGDTATVTEAVTEGPTDTPPPAVAATDTDTASPAASAPPAAPPSRSEKQRILFLISLLLVRGKRLELGRTVHRQGREHLTLVERGAPANVFSVENPGLSREDLERVKESLGDLLQMEI